jgi:hypothetical protein
MLRYFDTDLHTVSEIPHMGFASNGGLLLACCRCALFVFAAVSPYEL